MVKEGVQFNLKEESSQNLKVTSLNIKETIGECAEMLEETRGSQDFDWNRPIQSTNGTRRNILIQVAFNFIFFETIGFSSKLLVSG